MWQCGIVIGKFYPFHKGHEHLVQTGLSQTKHLIVLVCDSEDYKISAQTRAHWIKTLYPAADVRVMPTIGDDAGSAAWAAYTVRFLGFTPDVVFTSESYGASYATFMQCDHVLVDLDRLAIPISGTIIRKNPWVAAQFLSPLVRAYFVKRVVVLGAESTGTTTMARLLAEYYNTVWVPEYGRTYCDGKFTSLFRQWSTDELVHIATMQAAMEDALSQLANKVLFCDTDPLATAVWHEHYMHESSEAVLAIARARQYDLYLLTDIDIPLVQDGTRDGDYAARAAMHKRFLAVLTAEKRPFVVLSGSIAERMQAATAAIDAFFDANKEQECATAGTVG